MEKTNSKSLKSSASKKSKIEAWLRQHCPYLFNLRSLFYFVVLLFAVCICWSMICIAGNNFSQMFGWDYSSQFVPFAYEMYDDWHTFFQTGQFPLYSYSIFLGTDNIGSNSYYGLFDPFVIASIFFPRSWMPHLFLVFTYVKIIISALLMRLYLKHFGLSEGVCRLGALIYGFSGYMNFMLGFPSTVSACVYVPLILLGIEKVIKEKKVGCLVLGLFLEGITSFFFLVCLCIWGVIYALWRYFWTIKSRSKEDNIKVILLGVLSFALGLLLCSFTLLPSIRESSLSGRTTSIGTAYLNSIIESLQNHDFLSFFGLIFEEVGDNPGRELMGLISFFFPSGGYLYLPLIIANQSYTYDAWTASLFCYTPVVICFFTAIINSIWHRKWSHLIAILACTYLLFTNFSYYFFYAFSGNGYARWYMVLVPEIILYAMWGFDQRKKSPQWVPLLSAMLALICTILAFFTIYWVLEGRSFTIVNGMTYWKYYYLLPSNEFGDFSRTWYFYLQLVYIVVEGMILVYAHRKNWLPAAMIGFAALEIVIAGNMASEYQSLYYQYWMGGYSNIETSQTLANAIKGYDYSEYERVYFDTSTGQKDFQNVMGVSSSGSFHSLMNFDVEDFALMNRMKSHSSTDYTYGGAEYTNYSWSGYYAHKRFGTDYAIGYRYYVIKNEYSYRTDWPGENVPFWAEWMPELSNDNTAYRVYRISDDKYLELGHAVDSSQVYRLGHVESNAYTTSFYSGHTGANAYYEVLRAGQVNLQGAIFEDDEELPGDLVEQDVPAATTASLTNNYGITVIKQGSGLIGQIITSNSGDGLYPDSSDPDKTMGMEYIFDSSMIESTSSMTSNSNTYTVARDQDHIVYTADLTKSFFVDKYDGCGDELIYDHPEEEDRVPYLNKDPNGCYIDLNYYLTGSSNNVCRVYVIGDEGHYEYDDEGNEMAWVIDKENQVLSFERRVFENAYNADSKYFGNYGGIFGLYANGGRAKYICFCFASSGTAYFNPYYVRYAIREYSEVNDIVDQMEEESLENVVVSSVNGYTFETNYEEERIVKTVLGYDAGWKCTATDENGNSQSLKIYKLDGGLVGFYAPSGHITYHLYYETPYLKLGVFAASSALAVLSGIGIYNFVKQVKKKKKELTEVGQE